MAISIHCPCSRLLRVDEALAGQATRCPNCGRRHLVPEPPLVVEPATAPFREIPCVECGETLLTDARYCHACGLPIRDPAASPPVAPRVVTVPPVAPVPIAAPAPRVAPVEAPPAVPYPFAAPAQQPRRHAQRFRGPFSDGSRPRHPENGDRFVAPRLRRNGFGKVSLSAAFISMLLGFSAALFAAPLVLPPGQFPNLTANAAPQLVQLVRATTTIALLFAAVGIITGFLGLFSWRGPIRPALWGLFVSFLALAVIGPLHDGFKNGWAPPPLDESTDIRTDDGARTCPRLRSDRCPADSNDQSARRLAPTTSMPQALRDAARHAGPVGPTPDGEPQRNDPQQTGDVPKWTLPVRPHSLPRLHQRD